MQKSRFSKSKTFTRFQLESSAALGADGITLNIFDMMGNGIIMSEGYQDVLASRKDFLNGIKGLGLKLQYQKGVKVLFSPLSSGKFKGFQSHLTPVRQSMLQDAIVSLEQVKKPLFVAGEPDMAVNLYKKEEDIILLINYSNDPVNELRLYMPVKGAGSMMEIDRLGKPQALAKTRRDGDYIVFENGIGALEVKVFKYNI